ncbi:MAG: hypothetical protein IJX98_00355 [Clostridia bacterium]|nr:hypothetical protein [Clostridia bacterium]
MSQTGRTLRAVARQAKRRIKDGFWADCKEEQQQMLAYAEESGLNIQEAGRHFHREMQKRVSGEQVDAFYERVKEMLLKEGEVSDAIGRLTDHAVYDALSYEEKQRYTLDLSERYLRALERFKRECAFEK